MTDTIYNFVINATDAEIQSFEKAGSVDAAFVMSKGDLSWCLQAYRMLVDRSKLHLILSNSLQSNTINIVHAAQLSKVKGKARHFLVSVQGDAPCCSWAHYHLVQNKNQLTTSSAFVPHWIQPNIVPRNPDRNTVVHVAYVGPAGTDGALSEEQWQTFLKPHNIRFTHFTGAWNDLSTIDVLIGIRSFDANSHDTKPPSRLFSAWHAGVPFIGGADSAYQQVGTPGEDYLAVQTPEKAVQSVLQLRDEDSLYKKLVQNGNRKALAFTNERIAKHWEELLAGPVLKRFLQWRARPYYEQVRFNSLINLAF